MMIADQRCFVKSITYNSQTRQYFQGVDTGKLNEQGDFVLLCGGGDDGKLRDIFVIPWKTFFDNLRTAPAIDTYAENRPSYYQYKFYVRDRKGTWFITFVKGDRFDVLDWHYDLPGAIDFFKPTEPSILVPESNEGLAREFGFDAKEKEFLEGKPILRTHLSNERDPMLTREAKRAWHQQNDGEIKCSVCRFSFSQVYGPIGKGFIEAHHKTPISELSTSTVLKVSDLVPVCSNCHSMLHRNRPWLAVEQLREIVLRGGL